MTNEIHRQTKSLKVNVREIIENPNVSSEEACLLEE